MEACGKYLITLVTKALQTSADEINDYLRVLPG
jgi:hypothetical protein